MHYTYFVEVYACAQRYQMFLHKIPDCVGDIASLETVFVECARMLTLNSVKSGLEVTKMKYHTVRMN